MIYPPPDENPDSFAESNPYLTVDTSLFPASFQTALLAALSNDHDLDEATDGLLIHSDNFQALNLLQARYRAQVKCIYIDPPYNTGGDGFVYKDNYQHSSWLGLFNSRLSLLPNLVSKSALFFASIDDNEMSGLKLSMSENFGSDSFETQIIIQSNKRGQTYQEVAKTHEYLFCFKLGKNAVIHELSKEISKNAVCDELGAYELWELRNRNPKFGKHNRPNLYFPIYVNPKNQKNDFSYISLEKHPNFPIEVYPKNSNGEDSCWRWSKDKISLAIKQGLDVVVGKQRRDGGWNIYEKSRKSSTKPKSIWDEVEVINEQGTVALRSLGFTNFGFPKPVGLINKILKIGSNSDDLILDYFAGSGTTAHAVINLNREDGGRRKYILIEQGEYFDTVLKPRVQKVVYAENWKDGKPQADKESSLHGVPQIVKVLKLESYEDTLNNLVLKDNGDLFAKLNDGAKEDYLLRYMLADQSRDSLLNTDVFRRPFNYQMDIATNSAGATERVNIDLVETFNYLLGLRVHAVKDRIEKDGYLAVEGTLLDGETALVLWRDCEKMEYEGLDALLSRLKINPQDSEYDTVYINGDHNIATVWENENGVTGRLKIRQIESEFMALMFGEAQ